MFTSIPQGESGWARALDQAQIPVLQRTVDELARLRENEERVVARDIARVLLRDPMFSLRVLRHLEAHRSAIQITDITTVEHALMMLGITPFFAHFGDLPAVEAVLAAQPRALDGLMRVFDRAHHAALYAYNWAVFRHDLRADEVAIAALLHDLADMLIWCFAPELALQIDAMLQADASLRSSAAQSRVLGFKLSSLRAALIAQWKLATMLQFLMDDSHATQPRAVNVALAVNLARHSAQGWDNPALPDDYAQIQQFLRLPQPEALSRIRHTAVQAANGAGWYHRVGIPVPEDLASPLAGIQDCADTDDS